MRDEDQSRDRRSFLQAAGLLAAAGVIDGIFTAAQARSVVLPFANGERPLVAYPQKRPLIRQTTRPPQLETPFAVFKEGVLTPNDAFFVRYHLANIPLSIDTETYRLKVSGLVERPLSLSLAELRSLFNETEIIAVNQCSGNSRGFVEPRVGGGQLGNGAMGNAKWRGVPLKALLDKAGVKAEAVQITFKGLDAPLLPATPEFVKALDVEHARDGEVLLAYAMNDADLPLLNGYPLRLVVPGYYGTYWVKHLSEINVVDKEFQGFFMGKGYRIPDNECGCVEPGTAAKATRPIGRMVVRSFITSLEHGAALRVGQSTKVHGIAFDGGSGIRAVDLSLDNGKTWQGAKLGRDYGRYSFRPWQFDLTIKAKGSHSLLVRASANDGQVQPIEATWNPSGYRRNVIESLNVVAI